MKPILFSTPMVQAILSGTKTQTRRIVRQSNSDCVIKLSALDFENVVKDGRVFSQGEYLKVFKPDDQTRHRVHSKFCINDILWVRETWQHTKILNINQEDGNYGYVYLADGDDWDGFEGWTWKPSIFMPKEACRIFLKVTDVRVGRLQDISESDAISEGIECVSFEDEQMCNNPVNAYAHLWERINGNGSWGLNPWVWVIEFKKTECPEGFR